MPLKQTPLVQGLLQDYLLTVNFDPIFDEPRTSGCTLKVYRIYLVKRHTSNSRRI